MQPTHAHQHIYVAVDAVIFTVRDGELNVLLIQMKKKGYEGEWAFPGGLIAEKETTEHAARRILQTQTGVNDVYLEQLATFDEPKRDKVGRVISVAYVALISDAGVSLKTTSRYSAVKWWPVSKLPTLAYDHSKIGAFAVKRLQAKLGYTNIVWSLLPKEFTLTDLQSTYEAILREVFDKRNFRKKIISLGLIEPTGSLKKGESFRPAALFRFKKKQPMIVEIL